ncbi:MAG: hypothetical protein FK733_04910 [Asgard group archaeon]|nr:hypothetical protein [Asgard group archaeon]
MAFEDWAWILILIIEILVLTLVMYLSVRLICGRKKLNAEYFFRLLIVAIILAVGVTAIANAIQALSGTFYAPMFYIILTIGFILVIRYLITTPAVLPHTGHSADKYWQWAIWISIITLLFLFLIIFLVDIISGGSIDLFPYF